MSRARINYGQDIAGDFVYPCARFGDELRAFAWCHWVGKHRTYLAEYRGQVNCDQYEWHKYSMVMPPKLEVPLVVGVPADLIPAEYFGSKDFFLKGGGNLRPSELKAIMQGRFEPWEEEE